MNALTRKQSIAVDVLRRVEPVKVAARTVRVNISTVWEWLKLPAFKAALQAPPEART